MKAEAKLLIGFGAFFVRPVRRLLVLEQEDSGSMMLFASSFLGFLPGAYYLWWTDRMHARPSDRDDATLADGAGVVESFPGSSIWPFMLGMGALFVGLALVFGTWFALPAVALIVWALLGAVTESRRGSAGSLDVALAPLIAPAPEVAREERVVGVALGQRRADVAAREGVERLVLGRDRVEQVEPALTRHELVVPLQDEQHRDRERVGRGTTVLLVRPPRQAGEPEHRGRHTGLGRDEREPDHGPHGEPPVADAAVERPVAPLRGRAAATPVGPRTGVRLEDGRLVEGQRTWGGRRAARREHAALEVAALGGGTLLVDDALAVARRVDREGAVAEVAREPPCEAEDVRARACAGSRRGRGG